MITIIVNGRDHRVASGVVSYSLVAEMAGGEPTKRDYTITYKRGPKNAHGTMKRGDIMEVIGGMVFNSVEASAA